MRRILFASSVLATALAVAAVPAVALRIIVPNSYAKVQLTTISTDPFSNSDSQHATEVEPDTYAFGSTIVSVFQQGRYNVGGGASDIGWATSTDNGTTWKSGSFKGITRVQNPKNPYDRVSDPAIAYDAMHGKWLALVLPITGSIGDEPLVIASNDGLHWGKPVKVAPDNGDFIDKTWIACDSTPTSKFYGRCYIEDDDASVGDQELMSTSKDGGATWSTPYAVPNVFGLGGQPLAQPNGTVIVPDFTVNGTIDAFRSTNGGRTWGKDVTVATVNFNPPAGGIRVSVLPSAEIDGAGTVYVAWPDCSFRPSCIDDDIVYSSSADGQTWSPVTRVPTGPTSGTFVDFIPGIAVDPATSGATAHIGLTYYYYPVGACTSGTCKLEVGFIASTDAGATWTRQKKLAGPMHTTWLANTNQGYMVGDYISTSFVGGNAHGAFEVATAPSGTTFNEFTATSAAGLPPFLDPFRYTARYDRPYKNARHPYRPPMWLPI